jgi:hypothetical protein
MAVRAAGSIPVEAARNRPMSERRAARCIGEVLEWLADAARIPLRLGLFRRPRVF